MGMHGEPTKKEFPTLQGLYAQERQSKDPRVQTRALLDYVQMERTNKPRAALSLGKQMSSQPGIFGIQKFVF